MRHWRQSLTRWGTFAEADNACFPRWSAVSSTTYIVSLQRRDSKMYYHFRLKVAAVVILFISTFNGSDSRAGTFDQLVSYKCDTEKDRIVLDMQWELDNSGKSLKEDIGPGAWDPWSLIATKDGQHVSHVTTIHRICPLSDGPYEVKIIPLPDNMNLFGQCGQVITAKVIVMLRSKTLLSKSFGETCRFPNHPYYSEITFTAIGHRVGLTED